MSHIRSIIKTTKETSTINHKKSEIINSTYIQYSIANFREDARFFHDKTLDHWKVETMHQYKDVSLKEDDHKAHKNPIAMTIIRSMVINILHLCDVKSINEQLVKNRWDLKGAIGQLLSFSF
jgi:hypothetical protein